MLVKFWGQEGNYKQQVSVLQIIYHLVPFLHTLIKDWSILSGSASSLEPKLHPTTKRRKKKYPSQVDQVILINQHNPKYMATNAWEPKVHLPIYTYYPPNFFSDSNKIYTTKSPKIYNICSKEKINKRFLQLTCIGKDFKTTKHQLKTHKKISKIASRYNIIIIKVGQNWPPKKIHGLQCMRANGATQYKLYFL